MPCYSIWDKAVSSAFQCASLYQCDKNISCAAHRACSLLLPLESQQFQSLSTSISLHIYNEHQQPTSCTSTPKPTPCTILLFQSPVPLSPGITANVLKVKITPATPQHAETCNSLENSLVSILKTSVCQWNGYTNLEKASASRKNSKIWFAALQSTGLFLSLPSDNKHYSIKVVLSVMRYRWHKLLELGNTQDVLHELPTIRCQQSHRN